MTACEKCGGSLVPEAVACPFCGTPTAHAAAVQYAQAEALARAQTSARATEAKADTAAVVALVSGLLSLFFACIPCVGFVGVFFGLRARSLAKTANVKVPFTAWAGVLLGTASTVAGIGMWTWAVIAGNADEKARVAHIADLEKQSSAGAAATALDHDTACLLAELRLRKEGYAGKTLHTTLPSLECLGKLSPSSERAVLEDYRFRLTDDSSIKQTSVCFKRGAVWYVDRVTEDKCPE